MKAKPRKKYAEGGMVDVPRLGIGAEESLALESSARRGEDLRALEREDFSTPTVARRPTFGQAFAAARRAGLKEFSWNGGRYGTQLKGEDSAPARKPAAAKPAAKMAETTGPEIVVTAPRPKPAAVVARAEPKVAPAKPAVARTEPRDGLQNARPIASLASRAAAALEELNRPRATASEVIRARAAAAERAALTERAAQRAAMDKRVGLMQQQLPPKLLAYKKGGPVKTPVDRGKSNMAALAKALKQK